MNRHLSLAIIVVIAAWGFATPPYGTALSYFTDIVCVIGLYAGVRGWYNSRK